MFFNPWIFSLQNLETLCSFSFGKNAQLVDVFSVSSRVLVQAVCHMLLVSVGVERRATGD